MEPADRLMVLRYEKLQGQVHALKLVYDGGYIRRNSKDGVDGRADDVVRTTEDFPTSGRRHEERLE